MKRRRRKKNHNRGIAAGDSEGDAAVPSLLSLLSHGGTLHPRPWTQLRHLFSSSSVKMPQHLSESGKA